MRSNHLRVPRTARYHTLGEPSAAVRELWIVCHGYGQLAAPFLQHFERIASPARLIVAPEALSRYYVERSSAPNDAPPVVGASWMTREDRDHEIADHVAYLDSLLDLIRPRDNARRVRLRVLGFSQGVATVGRWVALGRVRVDELILWAGAFPPDVEAASIAPRLRQARVTLVTGSRDKLAEWAGADAQLQRFRDAGVDARLITFDGGHRLDDATLDQLVGAEPDAR
jgi:predicted esterase